MYVIVQFFFFNVTATTEIYTYGHTLSQHDALPICLYGDSVYVVGSGSPDEDGALTVERRFVRTGDTRQDRVAITDGVRVGERIVTSGDRKSTRLNSSH